MELPALTVVMPRLQMTNDHLPTTAKNISPKTRVFNFINCTVILNLFSLLYDTYRIFSKKDPSM
jgi:hypothetical protein